MTQSPDQSLTEPTAAPARKGDRKMKRKTLSCAFLALILFNLTACANYEGQPTPSPYITLTPAALTAIHTPNTPRPTDTLTATAESNTLPDCTIISGDGKFYALSDNVIFAWGTTEEEIDMALEDNFPEWAAYRQNVDWKAEPIKMGEIVLNASFQERFAINPAIVIVTLGESFNWQILSNKDLYLESLAINKGLNHFWFEWTSPDNEHIRNRYPDISNAGTYALYMFFDHNTEKLKGWCNAYQKLFKTSPLNP